MTGLKISSLPAASAANDTDQLEVNQGGTSRRVTVGQVASTVTLSAAPAQPHTVYATDFGAKFDGVTDDTAALQAFFAAIPPHGTGIMPPGTAIFKSTLILGGDDKSLFGAGAHTTVLKYTGSNPIIDLLYFVHPTNWESAVRRWHIEGFLITSDTDMTAGAALHVRNMINSVIFGVIIDGHEGSRRGGDPKKSKLWNGAWFDCAGTVHVYSMTARAFNDGVIVNGGLTGTNGAKADWMFVNGRILHCTVGLRIAGAYGGSCTLNTSLQLNGINCVVDTSITAELNREVFFGSGTLFDINYDVSVDIRDTRGSSTSFIQFDNCWIATGPTNVGRNNVIHVDAGVKHTILINGGKLWFSAQSGIKNDSVNAAIHCSAVLLTNCGSTAGFGFENAVGNTTSSIRNCMLANNGTSGTAHFNTSVPAVLELGAPNQFRVRETIKAWGAGQGTPAFVTSGPLGGSIQLQDLNTANGSGGAVVFGSQQGFFGTIKGHLTGGGNNTVGHVIVSTRSVSTDAALREVARFSNSGEVNFAAIGTTAAAANAVLDSTSLTNSLKLSTSSLRYKRDWEALDPAIADRVVQQAKPGWYRSRIATDNQDWSWYGLTAEQMAEIDPRLVQWVRSSDAEDAKLLPNGVMYERLTVMLLDVVRRQGERLAALEEEFGEAACPTPLTL